MLGESLRPLIRLVDQVADRHLRLQIGAAILLVIATGALAALSPLALKHLVDTAATGPADVAASAGALLMPAALYVGVLCGGRILGDVRPLLVARIDQRLIAALRHRYFAHVLRLPMAGLLRRRTGELLHSLDLACTGMQLILTHLMQSIAPVVVELAVMTAVLVQLVQPALVALFAATAALYLAVFALGASHLNRRAGAVTAASLEVNARLAEGFANIEVLRCFGGQPAAQQALDDASSSLIGRWLAYYRVSTAAALAATVVFASSLTACLAIAAAGLKGGTLTIGGFVLSTAYLLQVVRPVEALGSAVRDLARALGFLQPMLEVLREPEEAMDAGQRTATPTGKGSPQRPASVRFEGMTFGYDAERPVLRDLDLEIPAGTTTAVVGPSGSGKSTLIRLLLRLYSPQAGRILLDGNPVDSLPLRELRSRIALVPQDTQLLHTSVASNISLGMPYIDHTAIAAAASAAQLHTVIESLPDGYETLVGERGLKLSGGERQRLAIARALLRRPSVYLLDEPTSMLDSETEALVLSALRAATRGATTLIVAHRLSTVAHADEIVVLDQGRIRERGQHGDLLSRNGLYAQLWRRQEEGAA